MDPSEQGQRFSFAYVRAVASAAGYAVNERETDDDSVDLTIAQSGPGGTVRSPQLDVQVKHARKPVPSGPRIAYDLKAKNYTELRGGGFQVPRVLVLVMVPEQTAEWVGQTEKELRMRYSGYWLSLRDSPAVDNASTVRVQFPKRQMFTVDGLRDLMETSGRGEAP